MKLDGTGYKTIFKEAPPVMKTYIALFRGINVGGKNTLLMKELKILLENYDFQNVRTYIQSGNVVFQSRENNKQKISDKMSAAINKNYGFKPQVLVLNREELEEVIRSNPFNKGESGQKTLHAGFLESVPPDPDLPGLEKLKSGNEQFKLKNNIFYLYAPDGVGRSKLAARAEHLLGVRMTDRNWRTICKIMAIVKEIEADNA
jgi:uncharacterized protein (DUF1697 family)